MILPARAFVYKTLPGIISVIPFCQIARQRGTPSSLHTIRHNSPWVIQGRTHFTDVISADAVLQRQCFLPWFLGFMVGIWAGT